MECFPITRIGGEAAREMRRRKTRPAVEALNRKNAEKRVRRLLETNFTDADFALTLTWHYDGVDREHRSYAQAMDRWVEMGLPMDEDEARRALKNYLGRVKYRMRRRGVDPGELMYLYVLEVTHQPRPGAGESMPARYHFHMPIHAPGLSRDELEGLWPYGYADSDRLDFRNNGLAGLAAYITKQKGIERMDGSGRRIRRWAGSKNLKEPAVTVSERKISKRRAAAVAADVMAEGRAIFEKLYPGYQCVEAPRVSYSDFVPGAYIFARLRRVDAAAPWERGRARCQNHLHR